MIERQRRSKKKIPYGKIILILLIIAIPLGFLFDAACTFVEKRVYPLEFTEYVEKYSEEYKVPKELIYAVIKCESDFKSNAVSSVGTIGLMQMLPSTFKDITDNYLYEGLDTGMLYDPETNIKYGTFYLSWLKSNLDNWDTAIAAYNGGIGNVQKWLADKEYSDDGKTLKTDKIPFKETRNYVKKVNNNMEKYKELYFSE